MSTQFDASKGYHEALSNDILAQQQAAVEGWMERPSALANAHLHAQNELNRLVLACNRLAWGTLPDDTREPTGEETAALLQHLNAEDCQKLLRDMRLAAEQRSLVMRIEHAERQHAERLAAEQAEMARAEAEAQELAAFEAFDAAGRAARFEAWRAAEKG
ncbi:MAG: hypothetical protein H7X92_00445 [Chitinophagales bacterium]|nr:hypothetical protein [Hyphomicrobiales bacterium]